MGLDSVSRSNLYNESVNYIKTKISQKPEILIICGSGLSGLADTLKNSIGISYKDIPNFPISTVDGHKGQLVFGTLSGKYVVCMQGRFHYYEGYSLEETTMPVRVANLLGAKCLLVTNAAGSVNPDYRVGDIMIIKDHLNFLGFGGQHPLRGPNDNSFGPRFFPMNRAYDATLRKTALEIARELQISDNVFEGVYALLGGPSYETVAEVRALRVLGADTVGMSTVPEVLVAKHAGMKVFGLSFVTNVGIDSYSDFNEPNHAEVLDAIDSKKDKLKEFVTKLVEQM